MHAVLRVARRSGFGHLQHKQHKARQTEDQGQYHDGQQGIDGQGHPRRRQRRQPHRNGEPDKPRELTRSGEVVAAVVVGAEFSGKRLVGDGDQRPAQIQGHAETEQPARRGRLGGARKPNQGNQCEQRTDEHERLAAAEARVAAVAPASDERVGH